MSRLINSLSLGDIAIIGAIYGALIATLLAPSHRVQVPTANRLDLAIFGSGYFQTVDRLGNLAAVRSGQIVQGSDGELRLASSNFTGAINPRISLASDVASVTITPDGFVTALRKDGSTLLCTQTIQIVIGDTSKLATTIDEGESVVRQASVVLPMAQPGSNSGGFVRQGWTETYMSERPLGIGTTTIGAAVIIAGWYCLKKCSGGANAYRPGRNLVNSERSF